MYLEVQSLLRTLSLFHVIQAYIWVLTVYCMHSFEVGSKSRYIIGSGISFQSNKFTH